MIHRDIKLDNLLFTENGDIRVCDFGFAREVDEIMTRLGTPAYIAPEVFDTTVAKEKRKNISHYD